ncbi:hypothetical protein [Bacillus suaedae]|uniref:Uncharacterized protein n=1 Tax=Halalkalibacter suaedae TaxID=2822140 RepID=A0A940WV11_9BACI|nr:hypothetical protein [Bacillus suaedae]MBP3951152.1 hypothetical protein [Bacillus suaedae]
MQFRTTLPAFYYSLNTEQYARGYIKKYFPELTFIRIDGKEAVCEKKDEYPVPVSKNIRKPLGKKAALFS